MSNLNDFIDPDITASDVVHSSGYGKAAAGGSLAAGGAGGLSMQQRRQQMYGRRVVGSYAQSQLGRQFGASRPRTVQDRKERVFDPTTGNYVEKSRSGDRQDDSRYGTNRQGGGMRTNSQIDRSVSQRQHFVEPPTRNYNPFG